MPRLRSTALVLALLVLLGALCCYLHVRKPRCVVVADDFGISMERSRGIIQALKSGVVTSTSVMANGDAAVEAIEMARANGLLGVVGLHLNLTEGRPLSRPQDIPSLLLQRGETHQPGTGLKGGTLLRGKMGYRNACGSGELKAAEAATEARAQLAWFEKHVGCMPRFVDGHQHCHVVPAVREALAAVFAAAGVRVTRVPKELERGFRADCQPYGTYLHGCREHGAHNEGPPRQPRGRRRRRRIHPALIIHCEDD